MLKGISWIKCPVTTNVTPKSSHGPGMIKSAEMRYQVFYY